MKSPYHIYQSELALHTLCKRSHGNGATDCPFPTPPNRFRLSMLEHDPHTLEPLRDKPDYELFPAWGALWIWLGSRFFDGRAPEECSYGWDNPRAYSFKIWFSDGYFFHTSMPMQAPIFGIWGESPERFAAFVFLSARRIGVDYGNQQAPY